MVLTAKAMAEEHIRAHVMPRHPGTSLVSIRVKTIFKKYHALPSAASFLR